MVLSCVERRVGCSMMLIFLGRVPLCAVRGLPAVVEFLCTCRIALGRRSAIRKNVCAVQVSHCVYSIILSIEGKGCRAVRVLFWI